MERDFGEERDFDDVEGFDEERDFEVVEDLAEVEDFEEFGDNLVLVFGTCVINVSYAFLAVLYVSPSSYTSFPVKGFGTFFRTFCVFLLFIISYLSTLFIYKIYIQNLEDFECSNKSVVQVINNSVVVTFTYSDGTVDEGKWRRGVRIGDDTSIKSLDSKLSFASEHSSDYSNSDESVESSSSDESVEKSEMCPSCKTLTSSFIKSFPNPNVMCVCCRDEFCPIYCTMPCGHFICEECKNTYYGDNIPDIGALTLNEV